MAASSVLPRERKALMARNMHTCLIRAVRQVIDNLPEEIGLKFFSSFVHIFFMNTVRELRGCDCLRP
jgi:hypothetical protein